MIVKRYSGSELYHHGIKGQEWGNRRFQNEDGSLTPAGRIRYSKMAKKDAKEYARAKMFYGQGAGNRRKLIKAKVEERSKNEFYKSEFEKYLGEQDMSEHAEKAQNERHFKDAANQVAKTGRGIKNLALGNGANVAASSAAIYSGYKYLKRSGIIR